MGNLHQQYYETMQNFHYQKAAKKNKKKNKCMSLISISCFDEIDRMYIAWPAQVQGHPEKNTPLIFRVSPTRFGECSSIYSSTLQLSCKHQSLMDKVVKLVNSTRHNWISLCNEYSPPCKVSTYKKAINMKYL